MTRFKPTFATQIFVTMSLVAAALIAAFAALIWQRIEGQGQRLAFQAALEDARLVALISNRTLAQPNTTLESAVRSLSSSGALFRFGAGPFDSRIEFYGKTGRRLFDSAVAGHKSAANSLDSLPTPPEVADALRGVVQEAPATVDNSHVAAAVTLNPLGVAVGVVRVVKPSLGMQTMLAELAPRIGLLALSFVGLVMLSAVALGRTLSHPIRALTASARAIAKGDRARALPSPFGREVTELTVALDEMRRELHDAHRIERLSQELSHELKNPIAAVRALTEALQAGAVRDPDAGPRLLTRIDEAAARMQALVADLLALARIQAQGIVATDLLPLHVLVDNACREATTQWHQTPAVRVTIDPTLIVRGDATWLTRAFVNLIDNALHAGPSATIESGRDGARVFVRVTNPGQIPAAICDRLFERFISRRPDGTGLGLAIVASVAEAHGGSVRLVHAGPPEVVIEFAFGPIS